MYSLVPFRTLRCPPRFCFNLDVTLGVFAPLCVFVKISFEPSYALRHLRTLRCILHDFI
jgi:hypothetical protein